MSTDVSASHCQMTDSGPARKFLFDRSFDDELESIKSGRTAAKVFFTQEQFDAARQEGYEAGLAAGQKAMMENQQQYANVLLSQIDRGLVRIVKELDDQWRRQLSHFQEMALLIARKIIPAYTERHGLEEIETVLARIVAEMAHEPRLVIRVSDAQFDSISERIKTIADQNAYSGKIVVLAESGLGPADCRIEWADGGIERDVNALWQAIDRIMGEGHSSFCNREGSLSSEASTCVNVKPGTPNADSGGQS